MHLNGCLCVLIAFGSLEFGGGATFSQPRFHCCVVDFPRKVLVFKSFDGIGIGAFGWGCVFFGIGGAKHRSMLDNMFQSASYQASKAFLDVAAERHKVLASNLANAETPGYRRVELSPSFDKTLKASVASGNLHSFDPSEMSFVEDQNPAFRSDPTGNNVSEDQELMLLNENALRYEALGQFASGSLRQLKTAITGRSS